MFNRTRCPDKNNKNVRKIRMEDQKLDLPNMFN
jgi:hypothetical protein